MRGPEKPHDDTGANIEVLYDIYFNWMVRFVCEKWVFADKWLALFSNMIVAKRYKWSPYLDYRRRTIDSHL